jgi:hypothetical protein
MNTNTIGEKPKGYIAGAYAFMLPILQEKVRPLGYALAVHGSMNRDFDLIAVPWDDGAVAPASDVHRAIFNVVAPYSTPNAKHGPEKKPHGRIAWIIPLVGGAAIDLSVMPRKRRTAGYGEGGA